MNLRAKYEQQASIPAFNNTTRIIASHEHSFTDTGTGLYLTQEQACNLLGVSEKTYRDHLEAEYADFETSQSSMGGTIPPPSYLTVLSTLMLTDTRGQQTIKLYNLELVVRIATRTRNTPEKQAIVNEMIAVYSQYQHQGFMINRPVIINEQAAQTNLYTAISTFNFSPERYGMVEINKTLDLLFSVCSGNRAPDGKFNRADYEYFKRCCHNTAHVASTGMTALQIRWTRSNPNHFTFGQQNFRGKYAPRNDELNNACNFLTDDELRARTANIDRAVSFIRMYIQANGPLNYHHALQMFTMYCAGTPFLPYRTDNWQDYPETAIDNLILDVTTDQMRPEVREARELFLANFANRHTLPSIEAQKFYAARRMLESINLQFTGLEDVVEVA